MNKMVSIKHPPDYDADGYGWAMAQAEAIRARDFDAIDWDNVAEEIETVGRSERATLRSALRVLMMHILKWSYQPDLRSISWSLSIANQRQRYDDVLRDNPSLKSQLDGVRAEAYIRSRIEAAQETGLPIATFPSDPPEWDVILETIFAPE
jgi:hypothetical protein